jgi:hypothetical protein
MPRPKNTAYRTGDERTTRKNIKQIKWLTVIPAEVLHEMLDALSDGDFQQNVRARAPKRKHG